MRVALLSDTHDDEAMTRVALEALGAFKPEAYLHAGDLVAPEMLGLFGGLPMQFVFGNNEYDLAAIRSRAVKEGVKCLEEFGEVELGGKRIALLHGHDHRRLQKAAMEGRYDYVVHGHTHVRRDVRVEAGGKAGGKTTRVINPGAIFRARVKTVALLDLATDELQWIELAKG